MTDRKQADEGPDEAQQERYRPDPDKPNPQQEVSNPEGPTWGTSRDGEASGPEADDESDDK